METLETLRGMREERILKAKETQDKIAQLLSERDD
jgi:flagellar motor switch protein FliM